MSKRTQQQPPKTPKAARKGVTVFLENGERHDYPESIGWQLFENGTVLVVFSADRIEVESKMVNEGIATHRCWTRVIWTRHIKG